MRKFVFVLLAVFVTALTVSAQDNFNKAWQALNKNNRKEAERVLSNPTTGDEFISKIYLNYYNGKDDQVKDFRSAFYDKSENPYPYVYALWFNTSVLGGYGKKPHQHQLKLIDRILDDKNSPGSLLAAAHYQKGVHHLYSNDFEAAHKEYAKIGNIRNWQYVGPFENLSGSGINKDYGPLDHPEPSAVFTSLTNAPIKWFTPPAENNDGWTPVSFQFHESTAVVYAQNFVTVNEDMEVLLNAGVTGSLRVWLNDEPVINERKERVTELDTYTVKCKLKKGTNRILVQLAYTSQSYPNFNIRLTDDKYNAIPGIAGSPEYKAYNKITGKPSAYSLIPHFAEAYFQKKVAEHPDNLLNYILLSDVYKRNKKTMEARKLLESALAKAPENNLVRIKLIEILIKENNRAAMLDHLEQLKKSDPESVLVLDISIKEHLNNEKYDEAEKEIRKREQLFGEDESTVTNKLNVLANQEKYEEMLKLVEDGFKKYPENEALFKMMYEIHKQVNKDNKKAMRLYEDFVKKTFNYSTLLEYSEILQEQGQQEKGMQIKMKFLKDFPHDPSGFSRITDHYYAVKEYAKAEEYISKALSLAPYNENYWESLGDIKSERKQTQEAINAYNKSLLYDPNQYDVINKVRKLMGKSESYKILPEEDIDAIIRNDKPEEAQNTDYGYYIIHDGKNTIMHPGGATEEYYLFILRITNEKGIDRYKESSIGYGNSQSLLIEKAEIVKKSGSKIQGERNDNEIVFTTLEVGDVVVFKYRIQNYSYGRFGKDLTDKYYFSGQIYTATTSFNLLVPKGQEVKYQVVNGNLKPEVSTVEDFNRYTWVAKKLEPLRDEPVMPNNCDIGIVLHVSTIPSWQNIATWYADILNNKTEEEFEITEVFNKLFPDEKTKSLSQFKKARIIYDYIEKNIRYSSVPFRQSAFVPQTASTTLNTKLGDCKDLSNLFVTLCRMAGIESQMVLVDTRDNGAMDMVLPSIEFNHCIAKVKLDNKNYYIELTNNNLPFASMPNFLHDALILEIPQKGSTAASNLIHLTAPNRTKDVVRRTMIIKPEGTDLVVNVECTKSGNLSSSLRNTYANLDEEKRQQEMEKSVAGSYKHNVKLEKLGFSDMNELVDSIRYSYNYRVKDEIAEIGSLQTFRVVYPDVVATLNNFSADERKYPIEYFNYEDADIYETTVKIEVPASKKFIEIPANETLKFGNMQFSVKYQLVAPNKLTITRKFISERKIIPAEKYAEFRAFFEKIIKAEQKMIAYK